VEANYLVRYSQQPETSSCSKPDNSSPCLNSPKYSNVNLLLSSHLRLDIPRGLFPSSFTSYSFYTFIISPTHASPHLINLDFIALIIVGEGHKSWSSAICDFLQEHFTSSLLGPRTLLSTLFSDNVTLYTSLNTWNKSTYGYKNIGKIKFLYTTVLVVWQRGRECESFWSAW